MTQPSQSGSAFESSPDWFDVDNSEEMYPTSPPTTPWAGPMHRELVYMLSHCSAMMETTLTTILCVPDITARRLQIAYLRDAAPICSLAACAVARNSPLTRHILQLCAKACKICGECCLCYPDPASRRCGAMCLDCAEACRAAAIGY